MGIYDLSVRAIRAVYSAHIATPPVLDADTVFPAAQRFAAAWPEIREEALLLARQLHKVPRFHELMKEQSEISANDGRDWRLFLLKVYGVDIAKNMAACPRLAELISSEPDVLSATLSFLAPHKHIPRHSGPFKGVLRFQLGVSVPLAEDGRPASVLAIEDVEYRIGDGDYLLWDDTFAHEVWNRSDETRVALLLDVRRRNMPRGLTLLSRLLIAMIGFTARFRGLA
ncbi:aspartyl/asparaginyl beta-hydroxylase domain-containing protein [Dyella tabacisoli]|uniref:Aspartyl/asparaginyl beta-hydroxylase domain-containing protein n=1 Tax=Dyella tabacisoli TaxID=2282381 RepID=A0A369UV16_9GAMM|nr:aspartyl/asparaginyl beta-hydroxylase domain-containing protein [Dyella tabacisoli]RDD83578.1 aspartyl/asparaginyl beta-hydroxylase domain-containing protein [Dyella tabacisoli]